MTYTGRRLDDETGLFYYRNRYYHAQLGRFVTRDPIGYEGSRWNLYEYVDGIPVNEVDPLGLRIAKCCKRVPTDLYTFTLHEFIWVPDGYGSDPCWQLGRRWKECTATADEQTTFLYCLGDTTCEKELVDLLNLIEDKYGFFVGEQFCGLGYYDTCTRWVLDYVSRKLGKLGTLKKLSVVQKDFRYVGRWPTWDHHSTVRVCFPSGTCVLLDQGWWGGTDHICFPSDVPPVYVP